MGRGDGDEEAFNRTQTLLTLHRKVAEDTCQREGEGAGQPHSITGRLSGVDRGTNYSPESRKVTHSSQHRECQGRLHSEEQTMKPPSGPSAGEAVSQDVGHSGRH